MLRKILLPALAAAALAGCATDYAYRGGNGGDYYYGQPRVEYRYDMPYGGYGAYGNYGPRYFYDRYGRLVYGNPYAYYGYGAYGYGAPYYGYPYGNRPRPPHGGGHGHGNGGNNGHQPPPQEQANPDRKPPWRDFGGLVRPPERPMNPERNEVRPRGQEAGGDRPLRLPQRQERPATPTPSARGEGGGGSRLGRVIREVRTVTPANE